MNGDKHRRHSAIITLLKKILNSTNSFNKSIILNIITQTLHLYLTNVHWSQIMTLFLNGKYKL